MRHRKPREYPRKWLILCEGKGDKQIIDRILTLKGIQDDFTVEFPGREDHPTGGRSKFGADLKLTRDTSITFRENVKVVLIVSDNDDDPNRSFDEVTASLKKHGFQAPTKPRQLAKKAGSFDIAILMIPDGGLKGNLETLCVRAGLRKWPALEAPLNAYTQATPAKNWAESKQSKMRIQALIAATCEEDPDTTLANLFDKKVQYHLQINDEAFDEIAEFLEKFEEFVAN